MVDNLRRELTQVIRQCEGITLNNSDIRKILNGKYKKVIEDWQTAEKYACTPINTDTDEDSGEFIANPIYVDADEASLTDYESDSDE